MTATVFARLKRLITEQLGVDEEEVTGTASFVEDFNVDALELADMVSAIEEEFGLNISGDDARRLQTVQDVTDYIEEHIA